MTTASAPFVALDPADTAAIGIDFAALLGAGETVNAVAWACTPAGPTLGVGTIAGTVAGTTLSGVALGGVYRVTATATTSAGQTLVQSITVRGFPA